MSMIGTATSIFGAVDNVSRGVVVLAADRLEASYVFPTRAHEAAKLLRRDADAGIYDNLQARALADRITADILSILHDKHVRVFYQGDTGTTPAPITSPAPLNRNMLNGLAEISHLAGNIGYIDVRGFVPATADSARMLDAAMDAVASSDAIILDLRKNHGGDPKSIARLLSHVLPPNTHLIDFIGRAGRHPAIHVNHRAADNDDQRPAVRANVGADVLCRRRMCVRSSNAKACDTRGRGNWRWSESRRGPSHRRPFSYLRSGRHVSQSDYYD